MKHDFDDLGFVSEKNENLLNGRDFKYKIIADFTYDWEYLVNNERSKFLYVSPSCERISGYLPDAFIENFNLFFTLIHEEHRDLAKKILMLDVSPEDFDYIITTKHNETKWVSHTFQNVFDKNGCVVGRRGSIRDITKRKIAEIKLQISEKALIQQQKELELFNLNLEKRINEELRKRKNDEKLLVHQSKLATMGEMIGVIAHQWKQPLSALSVLVQTISHRRKLNVLDDLFLDSFETESVKLINFMSATIDNFRNYLRKSKEKENFDIIKAIEDGIFIFATDLKTNDICIEKKYFVDNYVIKSFRNEFIQIIVNLISNSRNAIIAKKERKVAENFKGKITVIVQKAGTDLEITVEDNGGGVNSDIIDKIFEPFFTTEKSGTGIGLYMTKMIIENDINGSIAVANNDSGAVFKILLKLI